MDTAVDIDSDGNSIATQREFVIRKAGLLGTTVRKEFTEPGTSAQTIEKRLVFRDMLRFIKEHPGEIDYVIIYMRSRAFRNYVDAGVTERQLAALGVKLISAKEDFGDGIWGDAMKAVADIMNEVQVRMSGEDIRSKLEHKARSGGTISRAKLGYGTHGSMWTVAWSTASKSIRSARRSCARHSSSTPAASSRLNVWQTPWRTSV